MIQNLPRVEIQVPTSGFIIGRSLVGDALTPADESLDWVDFLPNASSISINRVAGDTGTLSVSLFDRNRAQLLENDETILPNRPIRVMTYLDQSQTKDEFWPLDNNQVPRNSGSRFTYSITNGQDNPDWEWVASEGVLRRYSGPSFGEQHTDIEFNTFESDGEWVHGSITFSPSADLTGSFWWYDSITGASVPKPADWDSQTFSTYYAGEWYTVSFAGAPAGNYKAKLWLDNKNAAITTPFHLDISEWTFQGAGGADEPMFTGVVHDLSVLWDKDDNASVVFTGVDATASLANTTRHGLTGDPGYRTWAEQVAQLAKSAKVPIEIPEVPRSVSSLSLDPEDWSRFGSLPSGVQALPLSNTEGPLTLANRKTGTNVTSTAYAYGFQTTLTRLEVGASYELTAKVSTPGSLLLGYALGVSGKGWGQPVMLPMNKRNQYLTYTFTATATTHVARIAPTESKSFGGGGFYTTYLDVAELMLSKSSDEYRLQDLAYEGPLSEHLTIAADSVGGQWGVERDGVVRFTRNRAESAAHFSDIITSEDQTSYTDIVVAYDTTKVVNTLNVENKGRDPVTGETLDTTYAFVDESSAAMWGPRAESMTFSLYDQGAWAGSVERRATEYLHSHSRMDRTPVSLTFRAKDNPHFAATVDIHDHIMVTRHGQTTFCHVYGVSHEITPTSHSVTLELGKHGH